MKLCGDVLPSIINEGSPTPSITFAINECRGFIVVTTLISALIGDVAMTKSEQNVTFTTFNI